jgi:hypothetical protein
MPLVRIDLRKGKDAAYRQDIGRTVYEALNSVGVPKNDRFQVVGEYEDDDFLFDPDYLGSRPFGVEAIGFAIRRKYLCRPLLDGTASGAGKRDSRIAEPVAPPRTGDLVNAGEVTRRSIAGSGVGFR